MILAGQVHAACGGASLTIPEADACFSVPFEKKMTAPANFRAQACLRALMTQHHYDLVITHTSLAAFFHPPGPPPLAALVRLW